MGTYRAHLTDEKTGAQRSRVRWSLHTSMLGTLPSQSAEFMLDAGHVLGEPTPNPATPQPW